MTRWRCRVASIARSAPHGAADPSAPTWPTRSLCVTRPEHAAKRARIHSLCPTVHTSLSNGGLTLCIGIRPGIALPEVGPRPALAHHPLAHILALPLQLPQITTKRVAPHRSHMDPLPLQHCAQGVARCPAIGLSILWRVNAFDAGFADRAPTLGLQPHRVPVDHPHHQSAVCLWLGPGREAQQPPEQTTPHSSHRQSPNGRGPARASQANPQFLYIDIMPSKLLLRLVRMLVDSPTMDSMTLNWAL